MNETLHSEADPRIKDLRLIEFRVQKLFDKFSYVIPLNLESRVTAIVAPNGAGKTLCLRMISGLFEKKWSVFTGKVFEKAQYTFNTGIVVVVEPVVGEPEADEGSVKRPLRLTVIDANGHEVCKWNPPLGDIRRAAPIERYLPFLTRVGSNTWRHDHSGDVFDLQEIVETYGDTLPETVKDRFFGKTPELLADILRQVDCHLIETQRLLILREDWQEAYHRAGAQRPPSTLAIARKAQTLKEIISGDINIYAALSQSLDQSFPKRVISYNTTTLPSEDLKARLQELDQSRRELMSAGILDTESDEPVTLPDGPLEGAIARVLSVYVEDTKRKLSSLSDLLARIKLFKELIDQRFVTKDIRITRQSGIEVIYDKRKVPIESLSSGEQHQLVLFFELLFEIKQNSLILIDEPELSLHVAWQKKFVGDLIKIISLNKFDVILATHSPQLIGRWSDLVVELGDVYEGDNDARENDVL